MTLVNVLPWIQDAQRHGYAVGAFNANTLEQIQAIVLAAQAENAPVLIQISHNALRYIGSGVEAYGLRYVAEIGKIAAQSVDAPVALHLDHATETEVIQAMALGFTSVMFDGGEMPLDENIRVTKKVREMATSLNVCLESELGAVPKPDSTGKVSAPTDITDPDDAAYFASETGIDLLAIALGSVHAEKSKHVEIDLERLKAIRSKVETPLVLHGSSGVVDQCIADGIRLGLAKVNVATQLNGAFTRAVRDRLTTDSAVVDPRKYLGPARDSMVEAVRERIRFLGSSGKAHR